MVPFSQVVEGLVALGTGVSKRAARSQAAANMLNQLGPEPKTLVTKTDKKKQQAEVSNISKNQVFYKC